MPAKQSKPRSGGANQPMTFAPFGELSSYSLKAVNGAKHLFARFKKRAPMCTLHITNVRHRRTAELRRAGQTPAHLGPSEFASFISNGHRSVALRKHLKQRVAKRRRSARLAPLLEPVQLLLQARLSDVRCIAITHGPMPPRHVKFRSWAESSHRSQFSSPQSEPCQHSHRKARGEAGGVEGVRAQRPSTLPDARASLRGRAHDPGEYGPLNARRHSESQHRAR